MQVSVIIPTYNRRNWTQEAVASILAQSGIPRARWEIVVVDDGSTDGTAAALRQRFGKEIRLVVLEQNSGVAQARNAGVAVARGEWLAFLDSDDLWKPQKLARHLAFAEAGGYAISQTDEVWVRNGQVVNPCRHHCKPSGDIFLPSLDRCLVSPSAVLLHRSLWNHVGGFDPSLRACEDYDLWLRIACVERVGLLPERLVIKRGGHPDQLSRQFWGLDRFRVASLLRLLQEAPLDSRQAHATLATINRKCTILARGAEKRGRTEEAERYWQLAHWAQLWVAERWPARLGEVLA